MRTTRPLVFVLFLVFASSTLSQQQPTSTVRAAMDAQSAALIAKGLTALRGLSPLTDITLTGTATRTVGTDTETGTIVMKAMGAWNTRVDFTSANGTWSEVHSAIPPAAPQGYTVGPDGIQHKIAGHNTYADASWFFPAFSSLVKLSDRWLTVTYVGLEMKNGVSLAHLHFIDKFPPTPAALIAKQPKGFKPLPVEPLTARELYLDPSTALPVLLTFDTHPDTNFLINIPVEIHFLSYQAVNGIQVPFHIQKFFNGMLLYDITIQSVTTNSNLSAIDFQ